MLKRAALSTVLAILAYFSLGAFPLFPAWWKVFVTFILFFLSLAFFRFAAFALLLAAAVPIAFHSFGLFVVYAAFVLPAYLLTCRTIEEFPEIFLLIGCAPLLTRLTFAGQALPAEFLAIFVAVMLFRDLKAAVVAGLACLWTSIMAIVSGQEIFGNLIVGKPLTHFLPQVSPALPEKFYDFSWMGRNAEMFTQNAGPKIGEIIGGILTYLVSYPQILLNAVVWASVAYMLGRFIAMRRWWLTLAGIAASIVTIVFMQFVVLAFYSIPGYDFSGFLMRIIILAVFFYLIQEAMAHLSPDYGQPQEPIIQTFTGPTPLAQQGPPDQQNQQANMRLHDLSLEESLKMQKKLQEHIKHKFQREVTSLDVDIVESTKLKAGEQQEEIIFSFTEYWKIVDKAMARRRGKLLNRFGDGAVYLFEDPELAVTAAKETLKELLTFNQKKNTLKNPFRVRVGLNTGEVVADSAKASSDVFSRVIDISAHLQEMGNPMEIMASEHTWKKLKYKDEFKFSCHLERDHVDVYVLKPNLDDKIV